MVFFHGTKDPKLLLAAQTFDPKRLQARDSGFFGDGFYVTKNWKCAGTYGRNILTIELQPGTRLFHALEPGASDGIVPTRRPSYHDALRRWYVSLRPDRAARLEEEFDALYDPTSREFERLGWYKLVTRWVGATGIADGVFFTDSEIVLTNPRAVSFIERATKGRRG
jgi:hypothetical protein